MSCIEVLFIYIKVQVLVEVLFWFKQLYGKVVVVKYGGNVMIDDMLWCVFVVDMVFLCNCGIYFVVVYGGGLQIIVMLWWFGIEGDFKGGFWVIIFEVFDVVWMVLFGQVGWELVNLINVYGLYVVGIIGEDVQLFIVVWCSVIVDGVVIDIGLVGDVDQVNIVVMLDLVVVGWILVVFMLVLDVDGVVYNINVDIVVVVVVEVLGVEKLLMFIDIDGLYICWLDCDLLVSEIDIGILV